jgi:hypothetical protein
LKLPAFTRPEIVAMKKPGLDRAFSCLGETNQYWWQS